MHESLKKAIIATLSYSHHFNFPLTQDELHLRLIKSKVTKNKLSECLDKLVSENKISSQSGYFFLPGQKNLIAKRARCAKVTVAKRKLANFYAHKISRVPGVVAVFLTGSLAVNNAQKKDDIDYLIITKSRRLWLTRLLLTLYLDLLALRRKPQETLTQDKLCLNLYLTTTSLTIPESIRSLYTAYELIQAQPLYDPTKLGPQLLSQNYWLKSYLPNYPSNKNTAVTQQPNRSWLDTLETLVYRLQFSYMLRRITREHISPSQAFFHPHNPSLDLLARINQALKS
jgi:hypothetical protein